MSYQFFDLARKKTTSIELENCTITGNSSQYVVKDGEITKYSIINGKVDKSSGEVVSKIELTNYQMTFIDFLRKQDDNEAKLDTGDLKDLSPSVLEEEMNKLYKEKNVYEVLSSDASKYNADLELEDSNDNKRKISIQFEKPGFFKRVGMFFKNLFAKIKNFFAPKQKKEKTVSTELDKIFSKDVEILPEEVYTAKGGEKPFQLSNKLGVSFYRLKASNPDVNLDWVLEEGQTFVIPQRVKVKPGAAKNLSDIAKITGVGEDYIKDILFGIEGRHAEPDLKPYYDGVPTPKSPKGVLTIGFGHTGRVRGIEMNSKNMDKIRITKDEAYEILAQDIITAKLDAIKYFGADFVKAPESIQNAIIDIVFNKGVPTGFEKEGSLTNNLKQNLADEDYVSAAVNTQYLTCNKGLKKRNVYRFISALQDLSKKDRKKAMAQFEGYYDEVLSLFKNNESEYALLQKAWENASKGKCSGFFS